MLTRGPSRHLDACLRSLAAQHDNPPFEVLVCSNGGPDVTDQVRAILPDALVCRFERIPLGAARNVLIDRARGEWLLFLDDDVTVPADTIRRLMSIAGSHPDAVVLGGPNATPAGSTFFQVVQGAVLASMVGSGPVRRRYGRHPAASADERFFTLCNMAVRREAMVPFPTELTGGEENAILDEMSRRGLRMRYDPAFVAFHERRSDLVGYARQMFKYGDGRGQLTRRRPASLRAAYAVPALLIAALCVTLPLAIRWPIALLPFGIYVAAVLAEGAKIGWSLRSLRGGLVATGLIPVQHALYGLGFASGLIRRPRRPQRAPSPGGWTDRADPHADESLAAAEHS
jgi:cellulose synthase/poly-beta-1,6-N-acetylglucosamine synthase-like glycosyltransferase